MDGTLLTNGIEVTKKSEEIINGLIEKGMNFSISTARTALSALPILKNLKINVPVALMYGACIYDIANEEYVNVNKIAKLSVQRVFRILKNHDLSGFVYTFENGEVKAYYENLNSEYNKNFVAEREKKYGNKFICIDSFQDLADKPIIYYSNCERREVLQDACEEIALDSTLNTEFYRDIYNPDIYFFELFSHKASKQNTVEFLKQNYGFEKVICFGDNFADMPMFEASDESYAVANAKDEVKSIATGIIKSNDEDGVAHWLQSNYKAQSTKHK